MVLVCLWLRWSGLLRGLLAMLMLVRRLTCRVFVRFSFGVFMVLVAFFHVVLMPRAVLMSCPWRDGLLKLRPLVGSERRELSEEQDGLPDFRRAVRPGERRHGEEGSG